MHSQSERVVVWDLDDHNLKSLLANLRLKFIRESFIVIVCLIIIEMYWYKKIIDNHAFTVSSVCTTKFFMHFTKFQVYDV